MKEEYDFSVTERGKFYRPDVKLNLPIYLEAEILAFVEQIAENSCSDISTVVNDLIKSDIQIAKVVQPQ